MPNSKVYSSPVSRNIPFDNTIAPGYNSSNVQDVLQDIRCYNIFNPEYTTISTNGVLNLTNTNSSYNFLSGSGTNYSVVLPNATTLFKGRTYTLFNTTNETIEIKNNSGIVLTTLAQQSLVYIYLQDNGSSSGVWVLWQILLSSVASGIINYNVTSQIAFSTTSTSDIIITGFSVTPQAGTYAIWYNAGNSTNKNNAKYDCSIYKNGLQIVDSKRTFLGVSGTFAAISSTTTISQFNGSEICDVRVAAPNGGTLTVNNRSLILIRIGT